MAPRREKVLPDVRGPEAGLVFVGLMLFFAPFGVLIIVSWIHPDLPGVTMDHPVRAVLSFALLWGVFAALTGPAAFRGWGVRAALYGRDRPEGVELITAPGIPFLKKSMTIPHGGAVHIVQILEFWLSLHDTEHPPRYSIVNLIGGGSGMTFKYGGSFSPEAWETLRAWLALKGIPLATPWSDIPRVPRQITG